MTLFRTLALFLWLVTTCVHAADEPPPTKVSFVVAPPKDGRYLPWRNGEEGHHYAGEIIVLSGDKFEYSFFTDVIEANNIPRDWSGTWTRKDDCIFLDHPGVPFPSRIVGYIDGVLAMITWVDFQRWKKFGLIEQYGILYFHPPEPPSPATPPTSPLPNAQPTLQQRIQALEDYVAKGGTPDSPGAISPVLKQQALDAFSKRIPSAIIKESQLVFVGSRMAIVTITYALPGTTPVQTQDIRLVFDDHKWNMVWTPEPSGKKD